MLERTDLGHALFVFDRRLDLKHRKALLHQHQKHQRQSPVDASLPSSGLDVMARLSA